MRKLAVTFLAAAALTLAPISSASAAGRITDDVSCFPGWHGMLYLTEFRGHVTLRIWDEDNNFIEKHVYAPEGYRTINWWPKNHLHGELLTGVGRVNNHNGWADVRAVNAGCTPD